MEEKQKGGFAACRNSRLMTEWRTMGCSITPSHSRPASSLVTSMEGRDEHDVSPEKKKKRGVMVVCSAWIILHFLMNTSPDVSGVCLCTSGFNGLVKMDQNNST